MSVSKQQPTTVSNAKRAKLTSNENTPHGSQTYRAAGDNSEERSSSLPPMTNAGKNVVYLDMKSRYIKSDGAYSVSQIIKNESSTLEVVDLSDNNIDDDGLMYISIALKTVKFLKSLNVSNTGFTEYGLRILLENINFTYLKYLNVSSNLIGNKGIEHLAKCLPTSKIDHLSVNSIGIDDEGAKLLGLAIGINSTIRILEIGWNNIKQIGAVALSRGLFTNSQIEELYMTSNWFGLEGSTSFGEFLRINRSLKSLDMSNNRLTYECAKVLASALRQNSTLRFLNLSQNNISIPGVYELLSAVNTETSAIEYLGLKVGPSTQARSVPIQKNLVLLVELIQQRRRFQCDYGSIIVYPEPSVSKSYPEDESMIKLARYLNDKRLRLVDMFRVLDKDGTLEISKNDFKRRLKLFEPRLTPKDILAITKNLSNGKEVINYSSLFNQTPKRFDIESDISRRRNQINLDDERAAKATFKSNAKTGSPSAASDDKESKSEFIYTRDSFENAKEASMDSSSNNSPNSSSTYRSVNSKTKLKPMIGSSSPSPNIPNPRLYRNNKNFISVDNIDAQGKQPNYHPGQVNLF